jgi:hypothetical protein
MPNHAQVWDMTELRYLLREHGLVWAPKKHLGERRRPAAAPLRVELPR